MVVDTMHNLLRKSSSLFQLLQFGVLLGHYAQKNPPHIVILLLLLNFLEYLVDISLEMPLFLLILIAHPEILPFDLFLIFSVTFTFGSYAITSLELKQELFVIVVKDLLINFAALMTLDETDDIKITIDLLFSL